MMAVSSHPSSASQSSSSAIHPRMNSIDSNESEPVAHDSPDLTDSELGDSIHINTDDQRIPSEPTSKPAIVTAQDVLSREQAHEPIVPLRAGREPRKELDSYYASTHSISKSTWIILEEVNSATSSLPGVARYTKKKPKHLRCRVPGCTYPRGFSRRYELERHVKSQHLLEPAVGNKAFYKCPVPSCRCSQKIWSRRDRFRKHLENTHPKYDAQDLIKISTCLPIRIRPHLVSSPQPFDVHQVFDDASHAYNNAPFDLLSKWTFQPAGPEHVLGRALPPSRVPSSASVAVVNHFPQRERKQAVEDCCARVNRAFNLQRRVSDQSLENSYRRHSHEGQSLVIERPLSAPPLELNLTHRPADSSNAASQPIGASLPIFEPPGLSKLPLWDIDRNNNHFGTNQGYSPSAGSSAQPGGVSQRHAGQNTLQSADLSHPAAQGAYVRSGVEEGFPCLFSHPDNPSADVSQVCKKRCEFVSGPVRHMEYVHKFFCCTKCCSRFESPDQRTGHTCRWRCVTVECSNYGSQPEPRCDHEGIGTKNTSVHTWNYLFGLARPGDLVPDLSIRVDGRPSPKNAIRPSIGSDRSNLTTILELLVGGMLESVRLECHGLPDDLKLMYKLYVFDKQTLQLNSGDSPVLKSRISQLQGVSEALHGLLIGSSKAGDPYRIGSWACNLLGRPNNDLDHLRSSNRSMSPLHPTAAGYNSLVNNASYGIYWQQPPVDASWVAENDRQPSNSQPHTESTSSFEELPDDWEGMLNTSLTDPTDSHHHYPSAEPASPSQDSNQHMMQPTAFMPFPPPDPWINKPDGRPANDSAYGTQSGGQDGFPDAASSSHFNSMWEM